MVAKLDLITLAVQYPGGYVKCQAWDTDFIFQTDRLVFDPELMDPPEKKRFLKNHKDWRDNPCLVQYKGGGDPEFLCKRGDDGPRRRGSADRGEPLGIEFRFIDENGDTAAFYCNSDWMAETSVLTFKHSASYYGDTTGLVIERTKSDGTTVVLEVPNVCAAGVAPWNRPPDSLPCGYESLARRRWG